MVSTRRSTWDPSNPEILQGDPPLHQSVNLTTDELAKWIAATVPKALAERVLPNHICLQNEESHDECSSFGFILFN